LQVRCVNGIVQLILDGKLVDAAATPEEALAGLQRHLVGRLADAAGPDPLVLEAVRELLPWRTNDVGSLASSLSISQSQLRRRCRTAVGLAPKALHRVLRFQGFLALVQHAIARAGRRPTTGWRCWPPRRVTPISRT
jgi:hypothetical protein